MSSTCSRRDAPAYRPIEDSAWPSVTRASSTQCQVHTRRQPSGVVCVVVAGELDRYGVDTLLPARESHHTVGTVLAFDLGRVSVVDAVAHRTVMRICDGHGGPVPVLASRSAVEQVAALISRHHAPGPWSPVAEA